MSGRRAAYRLPTVVLAAPKQWPAGLILTQRIRDWLMQAIGGELPYAELAAKCRPALHVPRARQESGRRPKRWRAIRGS